MDFLKKIIKGIGCFNERARRLTYIEFPSEYVWDRKELKWEKRKTCTFPLGRLCYVPPGAGEQHYLGILLPHNRGLMSHEEIRTIGGIVYSTFKDACYSMGLLDDDREYVDGIIEANFWASGHYVRNLFAVLLMSSCMSSPEPVFKKTWESLSDGILSRQRRIFNIPDLHLSIDELKNWALIEIDNLLKLNGSSLSRYTFMPVPTQQSLSGACNNLMREELRYDRIEMKEKYKTFSSTLTTEQRGVLHQILDVVWLDNGGIFFLYGYGGTGKTFIWKTHSTAIRSERYIVLNVASSGITSLLLPGGRTAHSRFAIPINIDESSTCNINPGTELSELILMAKLIIWDEAPMINRFSFEVLDRSMRDIVRTSDGSMSNLPFGGKTVVLGGDFKQILPVIPKASREDVVHATINSSYLWEHCKILRLTRNMRLQNENSSSSSSDDGIAEFSRWILKVGDGELGDSRDGFADIEIPEKNLICDEIDPVASLIQSIYPNISENLRTDKYFEDRTILAPTHRDVESINEKLLYMIPGDTRGYLSSDSVCKTEYQSGSNAQMFSVDFLNSIKCSGLPNHNLILKEGVSIMLLRNIDQKSGLCNGTRLIVTKLGNHILEAHIICGRNTGNKVFIPRMTLSNSDQTML